MPTKMERMEEFLNTASLLPLDDVVTLQTITLRKLYKLKLGDAIIAATAIVYDLTLITRNTSDFKNIQGLHIMDPYTVV